MRMFQVYRPYLVKWLTVCVFVGGCATTKLRETQLQKPDVTPEHQTASTHVLQLDASQIKPMYREIYAINLPTVVRVAAAENFDILQAKEQVMASKGLLESAHGSIFPSLVPSVLFQDVQGSVQATEGNLVGVGFNVFQSSIAVQWVLNPGKVKYEIIAAKKRLAATEHQEQAVILETLRKSAVQYYELILAQARVAASQQAVSEAEELLRINQLHHKAGTGIPADVSRAQAHLAKRQQELSRTLNAFYNASVSLSLTLHLDSSVTLVPQATELSLVDLVRNDIELDKLLELAVRYRPDLESVRTMVKAIEAKTHATWWGGFGPALGVIYQFGGIKADDGDKSFAFKDQQRFSAGAGWRWSLSSFGAVKTAKAFERQALIEADRQLDEVRAQVVRFKQDSNMYRELISKSHKQLTAAELAYRLIQANFEAGTMTMLDVLQSQDAHAQARLRYAETVVRYNTSQVNLLASLGLIDKDKLSVSVI
ncbi:MAG: TolC family protein [Planctomycetes bacterium]|nr:TolC family protein [Planctomycetota bacterium]